MKSRATISFLSGIALFLSGCDSNEQGAATATQAAATGQSVADAEGSSSSSSPAEGVTKKKPDGPIVPYPFDYCAVVGREFDGGRTYTRYYDGYEVKFCCVPCTRAFEASPEPWMTKIRAAHASSSASVSTKAKHEEGPPSASPLPLTE